ncbi:arginine--tRNA ligase [Acidihalobacter prosperus]
MKDYIQALLQSAVDELVTEGRLPADLHHKVPVSRNRDPAYGDFATSAAMQLAKAAGRKPREIAAEIIQRLPEDPRIENVQIAGPGFINVYLTSAARLSVVQTVLEQGPDYGRSTLGAGRRIQVEYVSANPTGPLHVGHGRGAAYGAVIANLLGLVGFSVQREYYVNDAGRQMDILAASVWLRYLERCGEQFKFPVNGYKGDYIREIAEALYAEHGTVWSAPAATVFEGVSPDEPENGDKEAHIDGLIERARLLLGANRYRYVFEMGLNFILDDIREDLHAFGVDYDVWYSETSLTECGLVNRTVERLREAGHVYEKDGALWFASSAFGDEKDRVVQRDNGQTTYFASDIAYHMDKFERGFERVIDVWGADHHGYVPRVKAALRAVGKDPDLLDVLLVQFVALYRGKERVQMSTRSGSFVTLRQLREEVGNDAARFFYVMRTASQHLDFDLELAQSQSADNPVYYIQYAHARVCSVMQQLEDQGLTYDPAHGARNAHLLETDHEHTLVNLLSRYPELIEDAALAAEPHQLAHFLRELAQGFHAWYNAHQFLVEDDSLRNARLNLCLAVRQVIRSGLALLGVSAPEAM